MPAPATQPRAVTDCTPPASAEPIEAWFATAYRELRRVAHARLRGGGRNTVLDTTALVHESYLRLSRAGDLLFVDRARFLVYAGHTMRSIIVDMVRQRRSQRLDGLRITLSGDIADPHAADSAQILRVHEALDELAQIDRRMAQVVELRWFAGLSEAEIAEALGVTDRTVRRDWSHARLLLAEALK